MFSPYYAWSGRADPLNHCAVNVALYNRKGQAWAMTERGRSALSRDAAHLSIGPSSLTWDKGALTVSFDEVTAPIPTRLRGQVRLRPAAITTRRFELDAAGRHMWRPIAPRAEVEVQLQNPAISWRGQGYFDTNAGSEPLEDAFTFWNWSRAHRPADTLLFYDVERRDGGQTGIAVRIDDQGAMQAIPSPPPAAQPPTAWRMPRAVRGEAAHPPVLKRTLEDTPFYTRSMLRGRFDGQPADIVHESLSLDRLRSPIVRAMLPFRMPRLAR